MENQAYKWLSEWVEEESGYFLVDNHNECVYLCLDDKFLLRDNGVSFREDMRQLLADAEAGRKLMEEQE